MWFSFKATQFCTTIDWCQVQNDVSVLRIMKRKSLISSFCQTLNQVFLRISNKRPWIRWLTLRFLFHRETQAITRKTTKNDDKLYSNEKCWAWKARSTRGIKDQSDIERFMQISLINIAKFSENNQRSWIFINRIIKKHKILIGSSVIAGSWTLTTIRSLNNQKMWKEFH